MFDSKISIFRSFTAPPETKILGGWIAGCVKGGHQYAAQVKQYRQTGKDKLKKGLPLATVGAVFTGEKDKEKYPTPGTGYRVKEQIKKRTGLIALDIDAGDNPHLEDAEAVRDAVGRFVYVAFAGLSVSGRGVWALVKVADPEEQAQYFEQLQIDFKKRGIILDSSKGKNPNDARFYSFDPDAYIADDFEVYDRMPKNKKSESDSLPKQRRRVCDFKATRSKSVFARGQTHVRNSGYTFTHGVDMHNSIFHLCCFLNFKGIPKHEAESWIGANVFPLSDIKSNCISAPYKRYVSNYGSGADDVATAKYEGVDMRTGEVLNDNTYPSSWDDIQTPEAGSQERAEATRAMVNDASSIELKQFYNL